MPRAQPRQAEVNWVVQLDGPGYEFFGGNKELWQRRDTEILLSGPYETGKCQLYETTIMTPSGPRRMGDLRVGDSVLSWDGVPTVVTGIYPQGVKPVYRVTLHDGSSTVAGDDHYWMVGRRRYDRVGENRKKVAGSGHDVYKRMTTAELRAKTLVRKAGSKKETRRSFWLPTAMPAQFQKRNLLIDPYVLGILIAEGGITGTSVTFSTGDEAVVREVARRASDADIRARGNYVYTLVGNGVNSYRVRLEHYNLMYCDANSKFIPADYLCSDISDRLDLLRGLMDGDGTVDKLGSLSYSTNSSRLIEDIRFLVESLGGYVSSVGAKANSYRKDGKRIVTGKVGYTARICLPPNINPFYLERKSARLKIVAPPRRFLDRIEYAGEQETLCISVAHPSALYLTDHFIVTHNTIAALSKLHALCIKYPGCRVLMTRKLYSSLVSTALVTYYRKILPFPPSSRKCPVEVFGGGRPETITYPNGSEIVVAGLDNADKILSGEYDFSYINQAEELTLHDWEQVLSRTTGRAGNAPYSQVIGDANPGPDTHWLLKRPSITRLDVTHEDNPALYDHERGEWTEQGERTIGILSSMTGLRYKRGFLGLWAGAEGQIYEGFDESVHIVDSFPIPDHWPKWRVIDFGYTHPLVCQWWTANPGGVLYLYREIYMTGRLVEEHVNGYRGDPGILALSGQEQYEATICDHDAEDRATLERWGIKTVKADKTIRPGIEAVQLRLRQDADGRTGVYFFRNALVEEDESLKLRYKPLRTTEEIPGYAWPSFDSRRKEQSPRDEIPLRADDHGLDCLRYMIMYLDGKKRIGKPQILQYA